MTLARRIIPTLTIKGRELFKGEQFDGRRPVGLAEQAARVFGKRGVDELIIVDIAATKEDRRPDLTLIAELAMSLHIPLTVGGGIRDMDDVNFLFRAGADKVCLGSAALENKDLVKAIADRYGAQACVVAIDYYRHKGNQVYTRSGTMPIGDRLGHPMTPTHAGSILEELGAGEILLTSIDDESMMNGYDLETLKRVSQTVHIPVIAHGGCGSVEDMEAAFSAGADGCAAGALFQFTDITPKDCARILHERGIETRI